MANTAIPSAPRIDHGDAVRITTATVADLNRGALLLDLLHCVLLARGDAHLLRLRREGPLLVQREDGREIVLELDAQHAAAVFHDAGSSRSPSHTRQYPGPAYLLRCAPHARRRTLERLAVGLRPPHSRHSWITTLCWSEGTHLYAPDTWSDFLTHGGWMVESLMMEPRSALRGYQRTYGLSDAQIELLAALLKRRLDAQDEWVILERGEHDLLLGSGPRAFAAANDILLHLKMHTPYRPS